MLPWSNHIGVIVGGIFGYVVAVSLAFGNMYVTASNRLIYPKLNVSVDTCESDYGIKVDHADTVSIHLNKREHGNYAKLSYILTPYY